MGLLECPASIYLRQWEALSRSLQELPGEGDLVHLQNHRCAHLLSLAPKRLAQTGADRKDHERKDRGKTWGTA